MGSPPQRGERYSPPGFFIRHGVDVALEAAASAVSQLLYLVYSGENHPSLAVAAASAAVIYFMRECDNGRSLGITKAALAAFNAYAFIEMVTTFKSAPIFTGELVVLAAVNYLVLSRFATRGGGETAA